MENVTLEKIIALCKRRGFVFPTSEIYGGLANSYDYGPVGASLLRNIRNLWWQEFIEKRIDMVGLDSQILLHARTWEASEHVGNFNDPAVEDSVSHKRYRADHLIEAWLEKNPSAEQINVENLNITEMGEFIEKNKVKSPEGNPLSQPKQFNQLFETHIGAVEGEKSLVYLRGETAQGIFSDFKSVVDSSRVKLPFGIGQIGKSFRNEITTGQFVFRTIELEQAEIEYFFDPEVTKWENLMEEWKSSMWSFVTKTLGVREEKLRWRRHTDKERSHYSKDTYDLDFMFPFGFKELWGIAYRTNFDLKQHMDFSGQNLMYRDPVSGKEFIPHVIEPAVGVNRIFLMVMSDAYTEEENRVVLKFSPKLAPYKVAVFPLVGNKELLTAKAQDVFKELKEAMPAVWDDRGNIGKRYLAQDEIGTPWCITVDYQTLEDGTVTVRDRDTTLQERIEVVNLKAYINAKLNQ